MTTLSERQQQILAERREQARRRREHNASLVKSLADREIASLSDDEGYTSDSEENREVARKGLVEGEVLRTGFLCDHCDTEVVSDLNKQHLTCPGCGFSTRADPYYLEEDTAYLNLKRALALIFSGVEPKRAANTLTFEVRKDQSFNPADFLEVDFLIRERALSASRCEVTIEMTGEPREDPPQKTLYEQLTDDLEDSEAEEPPTDVFKKWVALG